MFGVLTMHLTRLVNYGHSFNGAEDLYNLLSAYPLAHSYFHLFKPQRKKLPLPQPSESKELTNFYFMDYDREKGIATGKYHSAVGTPTFFGVHSIEGLKKKKATSD